MERFLDLTFLVVHLDETQVTDLCRGLAVFDQFLGLSAYV